jgi:hypothetical protein
MSEVNWALGLQQGPNPGERFAQSFQQGMQQRQQDAERQAMAALVGDPNNQEALQALARSNPQAAMQFQERSRQQTLQGLEQHRDNIVRGAQIIRQFKPQDQAGWDQVRQVAAQAGIDMSEVPAQFDPQYVQGIVSIADAFKPQAGNEGFTLSPGQVRYGANGQPMASVPGQPRYYPVAPGGKLVLDPSYGGGQRAPVQGAPPPDAIARLRANPHEAQQFDEIFGPGAAQRVLGGQTVTPSGVFPGSEDSGQY